MINIIIFGTGSSGSQAWSLARNFDEISVLAFADNDVRKQGTELHGLPVWSAEELCRRSDWDVVWIASQWHAEIRAGLVSRGVPADQLISLSNSGSIEESSMEVWTSLVASVLDKSHRADGSGMRHSQAWGGDEVGSDKAKELRSRLAGVCAMLGRADLLDLYLPAEEPRQRSDVRPAVRYLRHALHAFGSRDHQMLALRALTLLRPRDRAILVVWAELLFERGDVASAAVKAREALALFYDDIYTQRLFVRCAGDRDHFADAKDRYCPRPFESFDILEDGNVYVCNCTWMPFPVGNAFTQDAETIWHSPQATAMRQSILDGTFRFCSPMSCPLRFRLPKRSENPAAFADIARIGANGSGGRPNELSLSYDRSCNLSCPSCRTGLVMANKGQRDQYAEVRDKVVLPLLLKARKVYVTGSGDPFGSPHFRDLLKRLCDPVYSHLEMHLMTNGQLLTPRLWQELAPLHPRIRILTVSIDGATPGVYAKLRRGGTLDRIERVMSLLAAERRAGVIRNLRVNMVVQEENFREMRLLIEMCRQWSVDMVLLYRLRQWGTYSVEEFQARDIVNPLHPRHHELLAELANPVFRDPIVAPWDLRDLIQKAGAPCANSMPHAD